MNLGNADAGGGQSIERMRRFLVLKREVAGIVVHADAAADDSGVRGIRMKAFEKPEGFLRVLEMAERLGFQAEMEIMTCFRGKCFNPIRKFDQIAADDGFVRAECLV